MCQRCGHGLLSHYTWYAGVDGATCRECALGRGHYFVPAVGWSVSTDGTKPVLVLRTSLAAR